MMSKTPDHLRRRRAFTLTELVVVVGIIVLIVLLAIPAFRTITGNRSIESAQNQIQAFIGRARQEALGLQDLRGVLLFTDPNTGRAAMVEVYYPTPDAAHHANTPNVLERVPNRDEVLLPNGLAVLGVQDSGAVVGAAVIMFDAQGMFTTHAYTLDTTATVGSGAELGSYLGARVQPFPNTSAPAYNPPVPANAMSSFGFVVLPSDGWGEALTLANGQISPLSAGATTYQTDKAIHDTGIAFLVNRYNGTLIRTE